MMTASLEMDELAASARILLIGANDELMDRARRRQTDFVLVEHPKRARADWLEMSRQSLILDYEDSESLLQTIAALHQANPFTFVLSLTERGVMPAAWVADLLRLPGTGLSVVECIRNKYAMRCRLEEGGVEANVSELITDFASLERYFRSQAGPVIVKPVDGGASRGVRKVEAFEDLEGFKGEMDGNHLIAEPYLVGPEYSVETFSSAGIHCVLAITQKIIAGEAAENPFVEVGHLMPAAIGRSQAEQVSRYVSACLDAIGLVDGPAHTEIKFTPDGPRIIETHNRVGGDHIADLLKLSHGIDVLDLCIRWALNREAPAAHPSLERYAAIRYITGTPGTVRSISGVRSARFLPGVVDLHVGVSEGDDIARLLSSSDRVGYVICIGDTAEEALHRAETVLSSINIETRGD